MTGKVTTSGMDPTTAEDGAAGNDSLVGESSPIEAGLCMRLG